MNEEEIIKTLNYQLKMKDTDVYTPINYDAIQGLLDLYYKQQKEIEKQQEQIEKLLNIKLYACDENKNKECDKKHCYINGGECDATTDITKVKYINLDDYIHKDKIKELKEFYIKDYLNRNITLIPLNNLVKNINILLGE